MTLVNELSNLVDTEIAMTMTDGLIYRGVLKKFDAETVVLVKVYEASKKDINWVETKKTNEKGEKMKAVKGFIYWRKITLPRLMARTSKILRFWPWEP